MQGIAVRCGWSLLALLGCLVSQAAELTDGDAQTATLLKQKESRWLSLYQHPDRIDPHTGNLSIAYVDARIPGPGGFDITVTRSYDVAKIQSFNPSWGVTLEGNPPDGRVLGLGWKIAVAPIVKIDLFGTGSQEPYLREYDNICRGTVANNGSLHSIEKPDGTSIPLHISNTSAALASTDGWLLTCSSNTYTLRSPDGRSYTLGDVWENRPPNSTTGPTDVKMALTLQATRVTDANGNWYDIAYRASRFQQTAKPGSNAFNLNLTYREPAEVRASDGRVLTFVYTDTLAIDMPTAIITKTALQRISFANGEVSYAVGGGHQDGLLTSVTYPTGLTWRYEYHPLVSADPARPRPRLSDWARFNPLENRWIYQRTPDVSEYGLTSLEGRSNRLSRVTLPTGTTVDYDYVASELISVWRNPAGATCRGARGDLYELIPPLIGGLYHQYLRVRSKVTSAASRWDYSYTLGGSGQYDVTTVVGPEGTKVFKHIGTGYFVPAQWASQPLHAQLDAAAGCDSTGSYTINNFAGGAWRMGLLVEESIPALGATTTYEWVGRKRDDLDRYTPTMARVPLIGDTVNGRPKTSGLYMVPVYAADLATRTVRRDGATYTSTYSNYDAYGQPGTVVESGINGGNRTTTLTYLNNTSKWILSRLKDESFSGGSTFRTFDTNGNLSNITRDGVATSFTYTSQGDIATRTLPRGLIHSYSNYKRGIAQTESQPEGITITRAVDDAGNITSETNGEGRTTAYTYDGLNRVISVVYPTGNPKTISYTATTKTATRGSLVELTQYNGFGFPSSTTLGGVRVSYGYDSLGRKTFESNPDSRLGTTYEYDALNRVFRVTSPNGNLINVTYGAGIKTVTDERSNVTTYTYRSYGNPDEQHVMGIAAPDSAANVSIARNARDLVTSVTQGGFTRSYGYNANYYLTSITNPEMGTTAYGRDAAGNMTSRVVGASGTTTYTYDGQNRLTNVVYPGSGTPAVAHTYSRTHKIRTAGSSVAARSYDYDANDNLTSESLTIEGLTFTATYGYNGNDQLTSTTYPRSGRTINYSPDVLGRPTQVSGYVNSVSYWPSGQIRQIDYANGTVSAYSQNERLWPTSFSTQRAGTFYVDSVYGYDGIGNLTSISDSADSSYSRTLGYDNLNRVTSAAGPWGVGNINYDGVGNIRSLILGSLGVVYTYDANNRLNSVAGLANGTLTYDVYGNVTGDSTRTYAYDDVPSLRCVNCGRATEIQYAYDAMNHRVSVVKGGVKTYEFYDSRGNPLIEFTPSQSNRLIEYIYLGGKRIAQRVTP